MVNLFTFEVIGGDERCRLRRGRSATGLRAENLWLKTALMKGKVTLANTQVKTASSHTVGIFFCRSFNLYKYKICVVDILTTFDV